MDDKNQMLKSNQIKNHGTYYLTLNQTIHHSFPRVFGDAHVYPCWRIIQFFPHKKGEVAYQAKKALSYRGKQISSSFVRGAGDKGPAEYKKLIRW